MDEDLRAALWDCGRHSEYGLDVPPRATNLCEFVPAAAPASVTMLVMEQRSINARNLPDLNPEFRQGRTRFREIIPLLGSRRFVFPAGSSVKSRCFSRRPACLA
jgi:hypothetical protein